MEPDLLLDFAFREVPADRWARSRPAVGYLQTGSLAPTDLTLEPVSAEGLAVSLRAVSGRPHGPTTVTHLSYSLLDADGAEVTEVVWVDDHDGSLTVTFRAALPGAHVLSVYLYSVHVNGSPWQVRVGGTAPHAELRDSAAQTDPLADRPPHEQEDFFGWMRARLERELSRPSPQATLQNTTGDGAVPVRRPVVGSGWLRPPLQFDANDNVVAALYWNSHLFEGGGGGDEKRRRHRPTPRRPGRPAGRRRRRRPRPCPSAAAGCRGSAPPPPVQPPRGEPEPARQPARMA